MSPETEYARLGELHLAYQVLGEGPPDSCCSTSGSPTWRRSGRATAADLRERLASFGRLIIFDKRGTGLSDPIPTASLPTLEEFMADIPAVLDTVDSERADGHRQYRWRHPGDAVRGRTSGAGIEPDPRRLLRPVARRARLPDRRSARSGGAGDGASATPAEASCSTSSRRRCGRRRLRRAWTRYERAAATPGAPRRSSG